MSQIFHEEVGLDEVVRRSDLIIIAEPNGRTGSGFDSGDSFTVKEVILGHLAEKTGDVIVAHPANEDFYKAQAEFLKEHGHQGAPSPTFPKYKSAVAKDNGPIIVFLRALVRPTSVSGTKKEGPVRYRYAVDGSVESVDKKQDVRNELKKRPAR